MEHTTRELSRIDAAFDVVRDLAEEARRGRPVELVERIEDGLEVNRLVNAMLDRTETMNAKHLPRSPLHEEGWESRYRRLLASGMASRTLVGTAALGLPDQLAYARHWHGLGDLHRVTAEPFSPLLVINRRVAFVRLEPDQTAALMIRQSGIVSMLVDLFERMGARRRPRRARPQRDRGTGPARARRTGQGRDRRPRAQHVRPQVPGPRGRADGPARRRHPVPGRPAREGARLALTGGPPRLSTPGRRCARLLPDDTCAPHAPAPTASRTAHRRAHVTTSQQLEITFSSGRSGTGPATWGQQAVWDAVRRLAPADAPRYNITTAAPLDPGLPLPVVLGALEQLLHLHDSLHTRLHPDADGRLRQTVDPAGRLAVHLRRADGGADGAAAAGAALHDELAALPFDCAREWPIRVGLVEQDGAVRHISLVLSHTAVDGAGMGLLVADLTELSLGRRRPGSATAGRPGSRWRRPSSRPPPAACGATPTPARTPCASCARARRGSSRRPRRTRRRPSRTPCSTRPRCCAPSTSSRPATGRAAPPSCSPRSRR
ncbi:condensation domain-containing protein [Kitasatospora aburaviensis]